MSLVRILVDGYSFLHSCPALAPGAPRHSAAARDELIHLLTQYSDACGTPISVVFDGAGPARGAPQPEAPAGIEVLYSKAGWTADQIIERVTHRIRPYGEVLVVTDDAAERETVLSLGGMASNCANFLETVAGALRELDLDLQRRNREERRRFQKARSL